MTEQWIKKLSGQAGELYTAAELSKRGIPNALLPENFSEDDIIIGGKNGKELGYIQVKSCNPDTGGKTFLLGDSSLNWTAAYENKFVAFVWLGSAKLSESPVFWIARKKDAGYLYKKRKEADPKNDRHWFAPDIESQLNPSWKYGRLSRSWRDNWAVFKNYSP